MRSTSSVAITLTGTTLSTTPVVISYPVAVSQPFGIAAGSDGRLRFGANGQASVIGAMTIAGTATIYSGSISMGYSSFLTSPGPDGNMWFSEWGGFAVGKITPTGAVTEYGTGGFLDGLTTGPDGRLWYTTADNGSIGAITSVGSLSTYASGITCFPFDIATGPDGAMWFTEGDPTTGGSRNCGKIGRSTLSGQIVEYSSDITANSTTTDLVSGPDGRLWFTENSNNAVGAISTSGVVTEYSAGITGTANAWGIVVGPDGNLWFTESGTGKIARVTTGGTITEFTTGLAPSSSPRDITLGSDGNLWFTEYGANAIGKFVL